MRIRQSLYILVLAVTALAADWTQFRGTDGSSLSTEKDLPTKWSQKEGLRWKAPLPGKGLSSPVIAAGQVYVTACSGILQDRLHVLCFSLKSGEKLWERQFYATGNTLCHPKTNMAAPTPATDGQRVYALFATADLFCHDRDGNLLWYRPLVKDYPTITNQVGMASSPVLWKDVLIVPMENDGESFIAGIDTQSGKNRWKTARGKDINWVTPVLAKNFGQAELIFSAKDEVVAYDPATGQKRWTHAANGMSTIPSPGHGAGLIFVPGGDMVALKPSKTESIPEVVWKSNKLKSGFASPVSYDGKLYAVNNAGVLNCADTADGKVLWQQRVKGPISASPIIADGKAYVVAEDGSTSIVALGAEPKLLATNSLGETMLATPAIADGAIFLRSDQHVYCIGK
jgi:outer membrane protein assembly factor BamB